MSAERPKLILASGSSRRRDLLAVAGFQFDVIVPDPTAECGVCSRETPPELVARLAHQKAADVAARCSCGLILAADTVAECGGRILGKPANRQHARQMLTLLRGRLHHVYTGVCLWNRPDDRKLVKVDTTELIMDEFSDTQIESYLDSGAWEDKAGGFGYQDGNDWLKITNGSPSNVVGLPMELLSEMLNDFA